MSVIIAASAQTPADVHAALADTVPVNGLLQKFEALSVPGKAAVAGGAVVGIVLLSKLFGK